MLVSLLAGIGCSDAGKHLVRGDEVVREFKAHGVVLQDSGLFGQKDVITAGYFSTTPKIAKVTLFVAVCRSDEIARKIALRSSSPLDATATVKRRKNVVVFLAPNIDRRSRRGALEALTSL